MRHLRSAAYARRLALLTTTAVVLALVGAAINTKSAPARARTATTITLAAVTSSATSASSTTTSTTMPMWPPPCGETGMDGRVTASDALYVIRTAIGLDACLACLCDADDSGVITASDALRVLQYAVGLPVPMSCPVCGAAICGDGVVNQAGEECDGFSDAFCPGLCQTDCRCTQQVCGDGTINQPSEECDGGDDQACPTICQADCSCPAPACGNDVKQQGEVCDGNDVGPQTCVDLGFGGGTLVCNGDCSGFDTTLCTLPDQLPPDPASIAPGVDDTTVSDIRSATAFLYTGNDPVQYGVLPGTIDKQRAAILRGLVALRDGRALPGVEVRVLYHGELGATQTRSDGHFDLAVNGGGTLTLTYKKSGYLTVQRTLDVSWQHYLTVPDVVMTPLDTQVTIVDLSAPTDIQVLRGSTVSDSRGSRQPTVMVPPATAAELVLADGSTQPLTTLSVRQTEYTVGDTGPEAMPGDLPFGVAYTYAVELSVDEAEAAGAETVLFDPPIYSYVENFLGFPIGEPVPNYSYERARAAWVRGDDGVVLEILSVSGGFADVDADGDGIAEDQAALDALGMADGERARLASDYSVGQSLWRVPVEHFSPLDLNWPPFLPDNADPPDPPNPTLGAEDDGGDEPCSDPGSILECQSQVVGEELHLSGTQFALSYRSSLARGFSPAYQLEIALTGDNPGPLIDVRLVVDVAGQHEVQIFTPAPNLSHTFVWDGRDVYGRRLNGSAPATVKIGYTYQPSYGCRASASGGASCPSPPPVTFWSEWRGYVGGIDASMLGLGGWLLDVQSLYDPVRRMIYSAAGGRRSATSVGQTIATYAGTGSYDSAYKPNGDGGAATRAGLQRPKSVALAADGSLYIAVSAGGFGKIRRVSPEGVISTVAGNGNGWPSSCGEGPATSFSIGEVTDLELAENGDLILASPSLNCVRRLDAKGVLTRIAGTGSTGAPINGVAATQSPLNSPYSVALAPDGSIYVTDGNYLLLRRIDPSGVIRTVAGGGSLWTDGAMGTDLRLNGGWALAFAKGGPLIGDGTCIRQLRPGGRLWTLVGSCDRQRQGSIYKGGGAAHNTTIGWVMGLVAMPDGGFYFTDSTNQVVYRVTPGGRLLWVAGSGENFTFSGEGGPPRLAAIFGPAGLALAPDGALYVADSGNNRVRRVAAPLPGVSAGEILIASKDARLVYVFDESGRHLRTVDTLTQASVYTFGYDDDGLLISVTDVDGDVTTIERDASGRATAIVAPGGQRSVLSIDADGYLTALTGPDSQQTSFAYSGNGLLAAVTDPLGNTTAFSYDADGRLLRDDDPAGGYQTLARAGVSNGFEVTRARPSGASTVYRAEGLATGATRLTKVFPDSIQSEILIREDGSQSVTLRDATTIDLGYGPDPRFDMQSPVLESLVVATPGGIQFSAAVERTATLSNSGDPLSLSELVETATSSGKSYERRYNASSRRWSITTAAGRHAQVTLDAQGRTAQVSPPGLASFTVGYDGSGRLSSVGWGSGANLRQTLVTHDAAGWLASIDDAMGRTTSFTHDAVGRVTELTLADGRSVVYGYDGRGARTSVILPSGSTYNFDYTPLGQLASVDLPQVGASSDTTTFAYDANRRLTSVSRPDGSAVALVYDSASHLAQVSLPLTTWTYSYDAASGQLSTMATPEVTTAITHDGMLETATSWSGTVTGSVEVSYNDSLQVASQTLNGSDAVSFAYDDDGLQTAAGSLSIARSSQTGMPTGSSLGGVSDTISISQFGEVDRYQASYQGAALYSLDYTRDVLGRVTSKVESIDGVSDTYEYAYDSTGQLIETRRNGTVVETASYDANGNRTSYSSEGAVVTASYDLRDRLLSRGTTDYSYSPSGELVSKTDNASGETTTYSYDAVGDLTSVVLPDSTTIEYVIDAGGRRVAKKVNDLVVQGLLYKDRFHVVAELDVSGAVVSRFVYVGDANTPAYMVKAGQEYRIISDQLGSVRLVVDTASGAVVQRIDYDSWGAVSADSNPGFQPFGFAGGLYDADTGLVRFGYRDYDATAGRWTAPDPLRFAGDTINLYGYVSNDPINLVDPLGLACPPSFWDQVLRNIHATNGVIFGTPLGGASRFAITALTGAGGTVAGAVGGISIGQAASAVLGGALVADAAALAASTIAATTAVVSASLEAGIVVGSVIAALF